MFFLSLLLPFAGKSKTLLKGKPGTLFAVVAYTRMQADERYGARMQRKWLWAAESTHFTENTRFAIYFVICVEFAIECIWKFQWNTFYQSQFILSTDFLIRARVSRYIRMSEQMARLWHRVFKIIIMNPIEFMLIYLSVHQTGWQFRWKASFEKG